MSKAEELLQNDPASKMLGIQLEKIDEGFCAVSMIITAAMTNGYDVCHGGFIFTLADTASAFAGAMEGETVLTAANQIEYLAPARLDDLLKAEAKVSIISGKNLYCDVKVCDQNDRLIALTRSKLICKRT